MYKKILIYSALVILGMSTVGVASAQSIPTISPWKVLSGVISPTASSSTVRIDSLGGAGTKCVQVNNTGDISRASAACGSGGSGSPGGASSTIQFNANGTFAGNNYFTYDGQQVTIGTSTGGDLWIPGNGSVSTAAGGIFMGPIHNVELHVSDLSDLWLSTNKNGGNGRVVLDTDSLDLNNAVIDTTNGGAFFGPIYMSSDNGINLDLGYNRYAVVLASRYMRPRNAFIGSHLAVATTSSTTNQFTVEGNSFMTGNLTAATITATGTVILPSLTNSRYLATDLNSNVIATNTPVLPSDFTAKGALLAGTGASAYSALTVGSNGQLLMASSTATNGLAWVATSSLGITSGGTPGGASSTLQFNANGAFAGDTRLTYNGYTLAMNASSSSATVPFVSFNATTSVPLFAVRHDTATSAVYTLGIPDRSNGAFRITTTRDASAGNDSGNSIHFAINGGDNNGTNYGNGRIYWEGYRASDGAIPTGIQRPVMNFGGIRSFEGVPPRLIMTDQVDASYCGGAQCSVIGNQSSNITLTTGTGQGLSTVSNPTGSSNGEPSMIFTSKNNPTSNGSSTTASEFIFQYASTTVTTSLPWHTRWGYGTTFANFVDLLDLTNTGNLGIGSSTPSTKLVVNGTTTTTNLNATGTVQFSALGSTGSPCLTIGTTGLVATSTCGSGSGTVNSGTTGQVAYYAANGTAVSGSSTLFLTNQNVGVGTSNPLRPLHVFGPVDTNGVALFESSIIGSGQFAVANFQLDTPSNPINGDGPRIDFRTSNTTGVLGNRIASISAVNSNNSTTTGDLRFLTVNNGGFVTTMTMTYAGNVGIGTSTPGTNLFVNGSYGSKVSRIVASTTLDTTYNTVVVDATAGALTVTLPSASSTCGIIYNIKKVDAGTSTITIAAASSQLIDGASSVLVYNRYTNYGLQADCSAAPYSWITLYP